MEEGSRVTEATPQDWEDSFGILPKSEGTWHITDFEKVWN